MSFANNLKKIMVERNISQTELSAMTGIGKSGISQYLSGKYEPKQKAIEKIAEVLECSVEALTSDDNSLPETKGLKNVSVAMAAKLLGKSKQFIRVGLQQGTLPFGVAVKTSNRFSYHISPKKLNDYIN